MGRTDLAILFAVLSVIVFIKHRANIARLLAGTEGKIGAKG
jgi:glycerol-3-phosphate acyltransferase PlsY